LTIEVGTWFRVCVRVPSDAAPGITIAQVSGVGDGACHTTMNGWCIAAESRWGGRRQPPSRRPIRDRLVDSADSVALA